jgi:hypothetical protein
LLVAMQFALLGVFATIHQAQHTTPGEHCAWCVVLDQAHRAAPPPVVQIQESALHQVAALDVLESLPRPMFVAVFFARGPPHTPSV